LLVLETVSPTEKIEQTAKRAKLDLKKLKEKEKKEELK